MFNPHFAKVAPGSAADGVNDAVDKPLIVAGFNGDVAVSVI